MAGGLVTSISQERAGLFKVGRQLRTREQAGFRFKSYNQPRPVTEPAPLVFVHITITNPKNYASDDAHARAVEAIGISRFPNTGISYNRLLFQSGGAQEGQPIGRRGAHTVNDKNLTRCASPGCPHKGGPIPSAATNLNNVVRAYAICQNVNDPVTTAQLDSLAKTIAADMLAGFVRRDADIHGHRCVAFKDCPASKMWALMGKLRLLVDHYLKVGVADLSPEDDMSAEDVKAINAYTATVSAQIQKHIDQMLAPLSAKVTALETAVEALDSEVAKAVWDEQIPDVLTPESGDTAAARTHLTWMPKRVADAIKPPTEV